MTAVHEAERERAAAWLSDVLLGAETPPFSLTCGGRRLAELLPAWRRERASKPLDNLRRAHTLALADPASGLAVRCEAVAYRDFPALEWTLHLRNDASRDSPLLADIQALDTRFDRVTDEEFLLHHFTGSIARACDYQPHRAFLAPGTEARFSARGGRPSDADLPYFNLEWDGGGVLIAVGWPGQWAARFARDAGDGLRVVCGQELTRFVLHPGEEVRTPLIALLFYRGEWIRAQNLWRRWMLAHNLPRIGGRPPAPFLTASSSNQFHEMEQADEANQRLFIHRYVEEDIRPDYWWMDAGWYITRSGKWVETGTWEVDPERFPRGLRAVSDHAHRHGIRTLLWFEPERVSRGSWLFENHPEWLLPGGAAAQQRPWKRDSALLNLGHPDARRWLIEHTDRLLAQEGIDLYRVDFNIEPLAYWRAADAEDRQGITEIRYVTGFLSWWDELRRRHPDLLIDTCASGGRRNDLETLRRAVPLHKTDHDYRDSAARPCQAYGIAFWMPFHGAPVCRTDAVDVYSFRCAIAPMTSLGFDVRRKGLDYPLLRRLVGEWRRVVPYCFGDFYPLTPYRLEADVWLAWQFHLSEREEGVVQVFRQPESARASHRFALRALRPEVRYVLTDLDTSTETQVAGRDLIEPGLEVTIPTRPGAALFLYRRADP